MTNIHRAVRAFLAPRRATLVRLEWVNRALSPWDECDAAATMPADLRRSVREPTLSRQALNALQHMLVELVGEMDAAWERRN